MNQLNRLSVQKGGGCEKTGKFNSIPGLDPRKLDYLIDAAILEWIEAHPEEMSKYSDNGGICKLFSSSKVIYL